VRRGGVAAEEGTDKERVDKDDGGDREGERENVTLIEHSVLPEVAAVAVAVAVVVVAVARAGAVVAAIIVAGGSAPVDLFITLLGGSPPVFVFVWNM